MARLLWLAAVILISVTIYAVIDCARRDRSEVKAMPKSAWLLVIILLPAIGVIMWFAFGRSYGKQVRPPVAPDDDPEFLRKLAEQSSWEAQRNQRRAAAEQHAEQEPAEQDPAQDDDPGVPDESDPEDDDGPSGQGSPGRPKGQHEDRDAEN
ncbi:PLD nuclease N-terminal domain-containing protein [Sediminivirga luteola]|uniref:Cardiolipin synthase N-terminal domain-containing protein n=1 Tax=Sediminivirga luteola TaxID=1774748 RepID=A0A8J2TUM9_9MICO|nr:PLD nuclease N-terminal domain-containing protein [Sediminivirga luteola]GGA02239.1 hypothetical protein GCM10011333_00970 [Sediminivirga luteola]